MRILWQMLDGSFSTAESQTDAHISDDERELPNLWPYDAHATFKFKSGSLNMRHVLKPMSKPILNLTPPTLYEYWLILLIGAL